MSALAMEYDSVLSLTSGKVCYGHNPVLDVSNFNATSSSIFLIRGKNGSGKTSLFRAIIGLTALFTGEIKFCNDTINNLPVYKRIKRGIQYLPQDKRVFSRLTIEEHLKLSGIFPKYKHNIPPKVFQNIIQTLGNFNREGSVLSGGQAKLMLMMTILQERPKLLILDEPYAGLDQNGHEFINWTVNRCVEVGGTCLIADHTDIATKQLIISRTIELIHTRDNPDLYNAPFELIVK